MRAKGAAMGPRARDYRPGQASAMSSRVMAAQSLLSPGRPGWRVSVTARAATDNQPLTRLAEDVIRGSAPIVRNDRRNGAALAGTAPQDGCLLACRQLRVCRPALPLR